MQVSTAEWYRTFLVARTPGHPGLFASDPSPTAVLRELMAAYLVDAASRIPIRH